MVARCSACQALNPVKRSTAPKMAIHNLDLFPRLLSWACISLLMSFVYFVLTAVFLGIVDGGGIHLKVQPN